MAISALLAVWETSNEGGIVNCNRDKWKHADGEKRVNRLEKLTKLNPKGNKYVHSAGKSELTVDDLNGAMAGVDQTGLYTLMVKVINDRTAQKPLYESIEAKIRKYATASGWKSPRNEDRIQGLTRLAMFEEVNCQVCPICKGNETDPFNPTKKCTGCNGTGRPIITDELRARSLGISPAAYCKTWFPRYKKIREVVGDCVPRVQRQINNGLEEGEINI